MIEAICPKGGTRWLGLLLRVVAVAMFLADSGHAQPAPSGGQVITPGSSIEKPGDVGLRAHTNIEIFTPNPKAPGRSPNQSPRAPRTTGKQDSAQPQ